MGFRKDTEISDETIIGYLLSSLPEDEMEFIEDRLLLESLTGKDSLAVRIADLRDLLHPIELAHSENFEPASDLTDRTMAVVQSVASDQSAVTPAVRRSSNVLSIESGEGSSKIAWMDGLVTVGVCLIVICLVLPGVWNAREQARRISCANKLRNLSLSMHNFANLRGDGEFPKVDPNGELSFAGVYAIRLKDAQLIETAQEVWCPANSFTRTVEQLPSLEVYSQSTQAEKHVWKRTVGGTYAYNLGYVNGGAYYTPSVREVQQKPLIGDFVYLQEAGSTRLRGTHSGDIANIVFTDGQVVAIKLADLDFSPRIDHPYFNNAQLRAAGLSDNDACLAPSFVAPFGESFNHVNLAVERR